MSAAENKAVSLEFYQHFIDKHIPVDFASKHIHPDFASYHMGSTYPPGRDGWVSHINKQLAQAGDVVIEIKRVVAESNDVWIWGTVKGIGPDRESVDILVFEDGLLKAKWDVQQPGISPQLRTYR